MTAVTRAWDTLERRSAMAFLVAGSLLFASPAHVALELYMDVPLPTWLVALFVLPGLVAAHVGLLGLYPRIADRTPRIAFAGGVSAAVGTALLVVILGWTLGASLLTAVESPPGLLFASLPVTMTLGFVLFGVAVLRSAGPARPVGLLLLSFALPWMVVLAATPVYGSAFPDWLTLAIYGPIPVVMLATGYALRIGSLPARRETPVEVAAD